MSEALTIEQRVQIVTGIATAIQAVVGDKVTPIYVIYVVDGVAYMQTNVTPEAAVQLAKDALEQANDLYLQWQKGANAFPPGHA